MLFIEFKIGIQLKSRHGDGSEWFGRTPTRGDASGTGDGDGVGVGGAGIGAGRATGGSFNREGGGLKIRGRRAGWRRSPAGAMFERGNQDLCLLLVRRTGTG